ncbi:MAG: HAD-IA family hydrolase [Acidimicrobiales bacterium]
MDVDAVFFDFGGVILSSPFDAFAVYETRVGLPPDAVRTVNATNPDTNAWSRFERNELDVDEFVAVFEREARELGYDIDAREVLACLDGELRPQMVDAVRRCGERFTTALLTNNVVSMSVTDELAHVLDLFDVIIESSVVGVRKPELAFYELACERAGVDPRRVVFLDDLGVNLKPARELGMATIKVGDPAVAIAELEELVGVPLR